jgi:hypothetical protein
MLLELKIVEGHPIITRGRLEVVRTRKIKELLLISGNTQILSSIAMIANLKKGSKLWKKKVLSLSRQWKLQ